MVNEEDLPFQKDRSLNYMRLDGLVGPRPGAERIQQHFVPRTGDRPFVFYEQYFLPGSHRRKSADQLRFEKNADVVGLRATYPQSYLTLLVV
jgi:hypothetical protein